MMTRYRARSVFSRRVWLTATATFLGTCLWSAGAADAGELSLRGRSAAFSELDGSAADSDGVADGTLTLDSLELTGTAEIVLDVADARFAVTGEVTLAGDSAIRPGAGVGAPDLEIQAGGALRLLGNSSVSADGESDGTVTLCAAGNVEIAGNATVSASGLAPNGNGGTVRIEAEGRLALVDSTTQVRADGATGGSISLVSCSAGDPGPGRSLQDAAVAVAGRVEALGTAGLGGTVEIEARQGGVAFGTGLAAVDAGGSLASGTVTITAATSVSPAIPPSSPAATVTTGTPSDEPCDCSFDTGPAIGELVVSADVSQPTGLAGTLFAFTGRIVQLTDPVVEWQWTFSDGRVFNDQEVFVAFTEPGLYGATVQATDAAGTVVESETGVVVFDPATQAPPELSLPDVVGDVSGDGAVTLVDAQRVAQHVGELAQLAEAAVPAADVDLDGDVTPQDVRLLGQAVAGGAPVPRALLPERGAPGARVNLIHPALLDPTALVEIQVGRSQWTQTPLRPVRGYATFLIPLDATVRGSVRVEPGPVDVRVIRDGVVVDTLAFEVAAPTPLPADPKAELRAFLDDYVQLFELNRQALAGLLDFAGVDGDEEELALAAYIAAQEDAAAQIAELQSLLDEPDGEALAELFFLFANANGFAELRQELDEFLATQSAAIAAFRVAAAQGSAQIDEVLAIICAVGDASDLLGTGGDILSDGCDALLIAAVIAAVIPFDGPFVDAALLFTWAGGCGTIEATVELALVINELVGDIQPDFLFEASTTTPGAGESVELRAEVEIGGLDDICAFGLGEVRDEKLVEELAEIAVKRLLRKKLALRAISKAVELLSENLLDELEDRLEETVVRVVNRTAIGEMLDELTDKVCDIFRAGPALTDDLSQILEGPTPDEGTLTFNADGTATYTCPDSGTSSVESVDFTASRQLCDDDPVEKSLTIECQVRPVTITIGDNGTANDDIFEVRIEGETVLTSSVPVRSISTTVELPVGTHEVQMLGRAAPDGIGTYFIRFSGATVIGGDATSGFDLTPGTVKTFIIRVQ